MTIPGVSQTRMRLNQDSTFQDQDSREDEHDKKTGIGTGDVDKQFRLASSKGNEKSGDGSDGRPEVTLVFEQTRIV